MNTINTVGNSPSTTSVYTTAQVNATDAVNTKATTIVEPSVAASVTPGKAVPILKPPSNPDYAGAKSVMSSYTALIVLMCEVNRESYAANRTMAKAQLNTRVAELHDVAAKRRTAAIVGLVLGVVSGAVGVTGGAVGVAQSAKGLTQLNDLGGKQRRLLEGNLAGSGDGTPKQADLVGYLLHEPNYPAIDNTGNLVRPAPVDAPQADNVITEHGSLTERGKTILQNDLDIGLRVVEAKSAGTQSMSVLFRALTDLTSSVGQSSSAMVSSQADEMAAEAEGTEASRQTTISNMQQFLDLMSKFTQILSSLLEAENKARSAAAQA